MTRATGSCLHGAFDGTSWHELAAPAAGLTPKPEFSFNAIRAIEGGMIVVGTAEFDNGTGRGALIYLDGKFAALSGGVSAIGVDDVAVTKRLRVGWAD
jgi:hypothetical protein